METAVLSEIVKSSIHRGLVPRVFFWRTRAGTEVDIVVEYDGKLVPIEVKLSAPPGPAWPPPSGRCRKIWGPTQRPRTWFIRAMSGSRSVPARPRCRFRTCDRPIQPRPLLHVISVGCRHGSLVCTAFRADTAIQCPCRELPVTGRDRLWRESMRMQVEELLSL